MQPLNALAPISVIESDRFIVSNAVHPLKALPPILVTNSGIFIVFNKVHPLKALSPIFVTNSGIFIVSNDVQLSKVPSSNSVTVSGIFTFFNFVASKNILFGILVIPSSNSAVSIFESLNALQPSSIVLGIYISFNDSQPENTQPPNVVIFGGNLKADKFLQSLNALVPISVTLFGIVTE